MALKICCVRDDRTESFMQPIFVRHVGEALRSFESEVNREGSAFNDYPEDFSLYELGIFDDSTGLFIPGDGSRRLALARDLVKASA